MTQDDPAALPGPGTLAALNRIRRDGFLGAVEHFWRRHGDTFQLRLGAKSIVLALQPDAVRRVTVEQRDIYDKRRSYDGARRYLIGDGLVTSTGKLWRRQRKLIAPFFTPRGIRAYVPTMVREAGELRRRWSELADSRATVDMGEEMMRVTAAIILRTMFSTDSDDAIVTLRHDIEEMISFANSRRQGVPWPDWLPTTRHRAYRAAHRRVDSYTATVIAQRRALPEADWPEDLLSRMMRPDPQTGATMDEQLLRDESVTAFVAGHETTARLLTAAWLALAEHPEVEDRLHRELDEQLGDDEPSLANLRRLPYTLQVVKEVLRLYPPAPFYARDATADDVIDGFRIPAGSAVLVSPYFTHRHPDFWPDPERFDPDRWTPEAEAERHPAAYHPFAAGPRVCIGNSFALLEAHLLLALLAREFAPRPISRYAADWRMEGLLLLKNGLPVTITRRANLRSGPRLTDRAP